MLWRGTADYNHMALLALLALTTPSIVVQQNASLYDVAGAIDIDGRNVSLSNLTGKVSLVVNIASD